MTKKGAISAEATSGEFTPIADTHWLVVGHGSVGHAVCRRLANVGARISVYDPQPRVPISGENVVPTLTDLGGVDVVSVAVGSAAASAVATALASAAEPKPCVLDWNAVAPADKAGLAAQVGPSLVDVGLLDSLDGASTGALVAISGPHSGSAQRWLTQLGFTVRVVSSNCGDAAAVKMMRSMFMKSLEALDIELSILTQGEHGGAIVMESIERSLGTQFMTTLDLLVRTNRVHGSRRAEELRVAMTASPELRRFSVTARGAAAVLDEMAALWQRPDAPAPGASAPDLMRFAGRRFRT
jgi:3-hydroxyisobutyrate dehydrogenase-like beta-hydroxyacid dehydrogenase